MSAAQLALSVFDDEVGRSLARSGIDETVIVGNSPGAEVARHGYRDELKRLDLGNKQANIDNALVHQKDALLELVYRGELHNLKTVLTILDSCGELWRALDYGYKAREILYRVKQLLRDEQEKLHHRATRRRNEIVTYTSWCDDLLKQFGQGVI